MWASLLRHAHLSDDVMAGANSLYFAPFMGLRWSLLERESLALLNLPYPPRQLLDYPIIIIFPF